MCIHSVIVPYNVQSSTVHGDMHIAVQWTTCVHIHVHVTYMHNIRSVWGIEGRMYLITNNYIENQFLTHQC